VKQFSELREPLLKLRPAHLVAIDEDAHELAYEIIFAIHRPSHDSLVACRLEGEVNCGDAFHRPFPIHATAHELARFALDDGAAAGADVSVSVPAADRAYAGLGTAVGIFHVGIEFHEWIPLIELVVVINVVEKGRRGGGQGRAPFDAKIRRLQCDHDEEHNDDRGETEKNLFKHRTHVINWKRVRCEGFFASEGARRDKISCETFSVKVVLLLRICSLLR